MGFIVNVFTWLKSKFYNKYVDYDANLTSSEYNQYYNRGLERLFFPTKTRGTWGPNVSTNCVYSFTNEELDKLVSFMDVKDKSVLTVGSGDQALNAIYHGASDVTIIDRNPMALYFADLKVSAIKNLDYKSFLDYFSYDNIFSHKYYSKISHDLCEESRFFWDNAILQCSNIEEGHTLVKSMFHGMGASNIYNDIAFGGGMTYSKFYRVSNEYDKLKQKLKDIDIKYINCNIADAHLAITDRKFDRILLSNMWDYYYVMDFVEIIDQLKNSLLQLDGKMQLCYFFTDKDGDRYDIYKRALKESGYDMSKIIWTYLEDNSMYDANEFPKNSVFVLEHSEDMSTGD